MRSTSLLKAVAIWRAATVLAALTATITAVGAQDWQSDPQSNDGGGQRAAKSGGATKPYLRPMNAPNDDAYRGGADQTGRRAGSPNNGRDRDYAEPRGSDNSVMQDAMSPAVESGAMSPVMSGDGSGLPYELWKGLDAAALEKLVSTIAIPPASPTLHQLWAKLITSPIDAGAAMSPEFAALRLEMLYRSGLAGAATGKSDQGPASDNALLLTLAARNELAANRSDSACELVKRAASVKGSIPARLKGEAILMAGYCSAVQNDNAGAGLAAELARNEGVENSIGMEALDALSIGAKPKLAARKQLTLLDYRLADRVGGLPHKFVLDVGEPALLAALAADHTTPVDLGLPATERAARINAIPPEMLAAVYRVNAGNERVEELLSGGGGKGVFRRAALFKAAEAERSPMRKARLIRAFLDEARVDGLQAVADRIVAPAAHAIAPAPEIEWFAETGIEIGLAAADYNMARAWIAVGDQSQGPSGSLDHWRALVDIADPRAPDRNRSLGALEANAGRFPAAVLYRVTTVLEALDYLVPIPVWDAANQAPQPSGGYLPATGVLTELQMASKKQEFGHTVLLVIMALGPGGPDGANLIALGDSIRALKRAGLETDARRLGLEALLATWPRTASN